MEMILHRVRTEKTFLFTELFPGKITLRVLVATFIAVLELTRLRRLRVAQDEAFSDIHIHAVEEVALDPLPPAEPSADALIS